MVAKKPTKKSVGSNLNAAKKAKTDEYYTQLVDIEDEMKHYRRHFKNKSVFLNCDDPRESNFWKYFAVNFNFLGLKKLTATHYEPNKSSYKLEIFRGSKINAKTNEPESVKTPLQGNGDFRSPECIALLDESDIVVTNPPFSLIKKFIPLLVKHKKKFIILGTNAAITYVDTFPLFVKEKIWMGVNNSGCKWFQVPMHYTRKTKSRQKEENGKKYFSMGNTSWFTNLSNGRHNRSITLYKKYKGNERDYPTYDNYNAIHLCRVEDIPLDYYGVMGVPASLIEKHNPNQFEILGDEKMLKIPGGRGVVNGKRQYTRVFIKRK